jgi:hypothetical protein
MPAWIAWVIYPLALVAMLGLLALVFFEAFSRQIPWWGKLLVMGFAVISVAVWLAEKWEQLSVPRKWGERLRDSNTLQAVITLVLLVSSALPNVLGMIRPAAAIESAPQVIETGVRDAN